MSQSGFKNEKILIKALHLKRYCLLNGNLRQMIRTSFMAYDGLIFSTPIGGTSKSDLKITIGDESHTYSIKKGRGNSIHQESLEDFILYLEENFSLPPEVKEGLQRFIWADGTLDGTGGLDRRIGSKAFKRHNGELIAQVQAFFDQHQESLLRRFLIQGTQGVEEAEYLYYGTLKKGYCCHTQKVLVWLASHKARGVLHIGRLTFQAWNRNLKGREKQEHKRGVIQIKWGSLKRDIRNITNAYGTEAGKQEEKGFVEMLNQKEVLQYWEQLRLNPLNHYAIHITEMKFAKPQGKRVWAKADAFIARGRVSMDYLREKEYYLNEEDCHRLNLIPLKETGISIKRLDAKFYQIAKISPSTFKRLFGDNLLAAGASLYVKYKKSLKKNRDLLEGWGVEEREFFSYYKGIVNEEMNSVVDPRCQCCLKKIKRHAKKEIKRQIKAKKWLADFLFFGKGEFVEPFTTHWLYEEGRFRKNRIIPFMITTGSGRSRGHYSIVLKPK